MLMSVLDCCYHLRRASSLKDFKQYDLWNRPLLRTQWVRKNRAAAQIDFLIYLDTETQGRAGDWSWKHPWVSIEAMAQKCWYLSMYYVDWDTSKHILNIGFYCVKYGVALPDKTSIYPTQHANTRISPLLLPNFKSLYQRNKIREGIVLKARHVCYLNKLQRTNNISGCKGSLL